MFEASLSASLQNSKQIHVNSLRLHSFGLHAKQVTAHHAKGRSLTIECYTSPQAKQPSRSAGVEWTYTDI